MTLKTNSYANVLKENDMEINNTIVSDGKDDLLPESVLGLWAWQERDVIAVDLIGNLLLNHSAYSHLNP